MRTLEERAKHAAYMREYVRRNRPVVLEYRRKYYEEHRGRIMSLRAAHMTDEKIEQENVRRNARRSEAQRVRERAYMARYRQNPQHAVRQQIRNRLTNALRYSAPDRQIDGVGCTTAELRKHLERQWLPGMSWGNHTREGWHIDHKIPLARFDLTDPAQRRIAEHYTNLQPMWRHAHQRKALKVD